MRVVIWGCGRAGDGAYGYLSGYPAHCRVVAFADSDPERQQGEHHGLPVWPPGQVLSALADGSVELVVVASQPGYPAIAGELRAAGFGEGRHFVALHASPEGDCGPLGALWEGAL